MQQVNAAEVGSGSRRSLRVVHFGKYYFPDAGGIESVTLSLAQGAVQAGHQVCVVCFQKDPQRIDDIVNGVQVARVPLRRLVASQPLSWRYVRRALAVAWNADLVHLHAPNMLGAVCALLLRPRVRLVVHWHSDVLNKGWLGALLRPLERALLWRADRVIATSPVYMEASEQLLAVRDKVRVVPIGAPDVPATHAGQGMPALPDDLAQAIGGRRIILAVGRLVDYKGFQHLINAAASLDDDAVVVIVGGGPLKEPLSRQVETQGLARRVILAGRQSDDALQALYAQAYLYCMPSTYRAEAFGVVLLEAMSHGLPIVATRIPGSGVSWVNAQGVSGVNVPVESPAAIAEACNELLRSPDLRARLAQGARARYLAEFTERASVERTLAVYQSTLSPSVEASAAAR